MHCGDQLENYFKVKASGILNDIKVPAYPSTSKRVNYKYLSMTRKNLIVDTIVQKHPVLQISQNFIENKLNLKAQCQEK